jgi:hypothetical protein
MHFVDFDHVIQPLAHARQLGEYLAIIQVLKNEQHQFRGHIQQTAGFHFTSTLIIDTISAHYFY